MVLAPARPGTFTATVITTPRSFFAWRLAAPVGASRSGTTPGRLARADPRATTSGTRRARAVAAGIRPTAVIRPLAPAVTLSVTGALMDARDGPATGPAPLEGTVLVPLDC